MFIASEHSLKTRSNKGDGSDYVVRERGGNVPLNRFQNTTAVKTFDGIRVLSGAKIRKNWLGKTPEKVSISLSKITQSPQEFGEAEAEAENKKRMFLKMAGVVGLGTAASLLFPNKAQALVFGSTPASNVVGVKDSSNARIDPAKEGGNLATIKTSTDTFVTSGGGGYVRQDSTATIAKESGGNLASIKTSIDSLVTSGGGGYIRQDSTGTMAKESGGNLATIATNIPAKGQAAMVGSMPVVIASDQTAIPVSGTFSVAAVGLKDTTNTQINPATDDSVFYLRRMVKLMESQATVDATNRQRVTVDAFATALALPTVTAVTAITNALPAGANAIGAITNIATIGLYDRQMFQDVAKNAWSNGIRRNLTFS